MRDCVQIGIGREAKRSYRLRDISIAASRRTRDADDVSTAWRLDAFRFGIPLVTHPSDATMSPQTVGLVSEAGGLGVLNAEGLWTRYDDPQSAYAKIIGAPESEATAVLQEVYARPVDPDLIGERIRELREGGGTVGGGVELLPHAPDGPVRLGRPEAGDGGDDVQRIDALPHRLRGPVARAGHRLLQRAEGGGPGLHRPVTSAAIYGCAGHRLTEAERAFFAEARPWGFILFRRNIDTPDQVRALTDGAGVRVAYDGVGADTAQRGGQPGLVQPASGEVDAVAAGVENAQGGCAAAAGDDELGLVPETRLGPGGAGQPGVDAVGKGRPHGVVARGDLVGVRDVHQGARPALMSVEVPAAHGSRIGGVRRRLRERPNAARHRLRAGALLS